MHIAYHLIEKHLLIHLILNIQNKNNASIIELAMQKHNSLTLTNKVPI